MENVQIIVHGEWEETKEDPITLFPIKTKRSIDCITFAEDNKLAIARAVAELGLPSGVYEEEVRR